MNKIVNLIYTKNLKEIKKLYPFYAKWLEEQEDVDWIKNPSKNMLFVNVGSTLRPVYDVDDPINKCKDIPDNLQLLKENATIIVGMGLGHRLNHIIKEKEKGHHVIVLEPIAQLVRLALCLYDFSDQIERRKLIICSDEKDDIRFLLGSLESTKVIGEWNMIAETYTTTRTEYTEIVPFVAELLNALRCNTGTIAGTAGAKIADNDIATLPYVIRYRGVKDLIDIFKGKPCILVSTGPSLARNIHLLKDVQDKVIIVAVGQALRPLLAYDIRPDFICTVDFGKVNMTHFTGLLDETVPLVTLNKAYAPLLKAYKGMKFISAPTNSGFEDTTHGILKSKGFIEQGGSVAHMSLGLGYALGCDPLIMIGQDLALSEMSHMPQADSGGAIEVKDGNINWKVSDPRCHLHENKEGISMGETKRIPGYYGKPVLTNGGLASFLTSFETMIGACERTVINATEGGAFIRSAKPLFLFKAIKEYCTNTIDKTPLKKLLNLDPNYKSLIKDVIPKLKADIVTLKEIAVACHNGLQSANTIKKSKNLKKHLDENEKFSMEAYKLCAKIPAVGMVIFGISRKLGSRELNVNRNPEYLQNAENRKDLDISIKRNIMILTAAKKAARDLLPTYEKVLDIFKRCVKNDDYSLLEPTGETEEPDLSDCEKYFKEGNFARPLLEVYRVVTRIGKKGSTRYMDIIQRAKSLRFRLIVEANVQQDKDIKNNRHNEPLYFYYLEEAQKTGKAEKFEEALKLLKECIELCPDKREARWGLATCLHHLGKTKESLLEYKQLIKRFPNYHIYRYEYGLALIKDKQLEKGLKEMTKVMEQTKEFDHFLATVGDIQHKIGNDERSLLAYEEYLKTYKHDYLVWEKKADRLKSLGREKECLEALYTARKLKSK